MAYDPTNWTDEVPTESPVKFRVRDAQGNILHDNITIEMITPVTPGTPLHAANLNKIEQGIKAVEDGTIPAILTAKGDLVTGAGPGTAALLAIGDAKKFLRPDPTAASGVAWKNLFVSGPFNNTDWMSKPKSSGLHTVNVTDFGLPSTASVVLFRAWLTFATAGVNDYISVGSSATKFFVDILSQVGGRRVSGNGIVPLEDGRLFINLGAACTDLTLSITAYI